MGGGVYPHLVRRMKCAKWGIVFVGCWDCLDWGLWRVFLVVGVGCELKAVVRVLSGLGLESRNGCGWGSNGDGRLL